VFIEACVETVASAVAAERGGAQRLEFCANLADAGTTPSTSTIAAVKARIAIPVFVIIRPRGGGFVYSDFELDGMRRDIAEAQRLGVDGIVTGVLRRDARVDEARTKMLVAEAGALPVTFHRAFDVTPDQSEALETLVACGVQRVLTSGGAPSALEGADQLRALVVQAAGRIGVLAGGSIWKEQIPELVRRSGVTEIHVRWTRFAQTPEA
jgi:copper homeostasis protein